MRILIYIALLTAALCSITPRTQAHPTYMEWQPPQLTDGQNSLKVRFRAKLKYLETPSPTKRQIQLISRPYQHYIICAEYATSATTASIIPVEAGWQQGHYQLITTEPVTSLEYQHPRTCTVNEGTYPYHFLDLLHSEKPFLAIESKPGDRRQQKNNGGGLISSIPQPFSDGYLTEGNNNGYSFDDQQRKHPPWLPFQTSDDYSLIILPGLKLPEELKGFLPGTQLYYDLLNQLGYGEEVNVIVRIDGYEPISIPVHRTERSELAQHMTSAPALLNWLAPKLNGRESLVDWLMNTQMSFDSGDSGLEKEFLESVRQQLAFVLEQKDSEFDLQFELSEANRWIRRCPSGKQSQQGQGGQNQGGQSSGAQPHSSTTAGIKNAGESTEYQQKGSKNKQETATGGSSAIPEVTITFVGNSNTGKSTLANLLLGFRHFREGSSEGLEQDYLHNGIRIRALPGYPRGLPSRYPLQYDIGRDDIIIFVLEDAPSADDIGLLKDIVSRRDHNQDRLIIVRNKYDTLRAPAVDEAERSNISFNESLLLTKDRIQVEVRRRLSEAGLSVRAPIIFTSADEDSWEDAKELYGNINAIIGDTSESWNRFLIAFNTIERICNEITMHPLNLPADLADSVSRAFRRFSLSQETKKKIDGILRKGLRKEEEKMRESGYAILNTDSIIAGIVTMVILPPELNNDLIARFMTRFESRWMFASSKPCYHSSPENTRTLLKLGADLTVRLGSGNTLFITLRGTNIARIIPSRHHNSVYQSGILNERTSIIFNNVARNAFLKEIKNPELFVKKLFNLIIGKMAYLKFIELRGELAGKHSCPGDKCPPPLKDFPSEPWFWQDCRQQ